VLPTFKPPHQKGGFFCVPTPTKEGSTVVVVEAKYIITEVINHF
jgi:hypothetical protein